MQLGYNVNPFQGLMNGSGQLHSPGETAQHFFPDKTTASAEVKKVQTGWNESSWLSKLQELADNGNASARDALVQYYSSKEANETAYQRTVEREDHAYERLMTDLKKAGISPYILSGATPMVSQASQQSKTSSDFTSAANNKKSAEANNLKAILALIGVSLAAIMHVL